MNYLYIIYILVFLINATVYSRNYNIKNLCMESELSKPMISTIINEQWVSTSFHIEQNGFTSDQLKSALKSLSESDMDVNQVKAKAWFMDKVKEPLMLFTKPNIKVSIKERLIKIDKSLKRKLSKKSFSIADLSLMLRAINKKINELNNLKKVDLFKAMALEKEFDIINLERLIKHALYLTADNSEQAKNFRRDRLVDLLRALMPNGSDIIIAKCLMLKVLK